MELLPSSGTVGYIFDDDPKILDIDDNPIYDKTKQEYRWTQYILAPLVLKPVTPNMAPKFQFILKNSYDAVVSQKNFAGEGLTLIKDFGRGVQLYKTGIK
jgi:hypothetical protein